MSFKQTVYNEIRTNAGKVAEKLGVEGIDQLWSGFGKQRTIAEGFETASNWLTNKNVIKGIAGNQKANQSSMNEFSKMDREAEESNLLYKPKRLAVQSKQVLKQFDTNTSNLAKQMSQARGKALNRQVVVGAGALGVGAVGYGGYKATFGS